MSEVILDTITGKSTATTITIGSTPVVSASANSMTIRGEGSNQTSIQQGLTKMWVQHNDGQTVADSFNVGSTTDNGTGDYTHAFSNNMGAANAYTVAGMAQDVNSKHCQLNMMSSNAEYAAASFRYQTGFVASTSGAQTNHDCNGTSVQICGDLA